MNEYVQIVRKLRRQLGPVDRAREAALWNARAIVKCSSVLIRTLHQGRWDSALERRLERHRRGLERAIKAQPRLATHGAVLQAHGEYTEAHLFRAFTRGARPPTPEALRVPPEGYLLGLADLVGELRRATLTRLLADDLAGARAAFDSMEKAYEALADANVPEGVLAFRAKLDADRAIVERTRGDLVTAKKTKQLENKIDGIGRLLDEAEGRPDKRRSKKADDDLDLDAAWGKH